MVPKSKNCCQHCVVLIFREYAYSLSRSAGWSVRLPASLTTPHFSRSQASSFLDSIAFCNKQIDRGLTHCGKQCLGVLNHLLLVALIDTAPGATCTVDFRRAVPIDLLCTDKFRDMDRQGAFVEDAAKVGCRRIQVAGSRTSGRYSQRYLCSVSFRVNRRCIATYVVLVRLRCTSSQKHLCSELPSSHRTE
jgi:hypothetical protein